MSSRALTTLTLTIAWACGPTQPTQAPEPASEPASEPAVELAADEERLAEVGWDDVRAGLEALICTHTVEIPDRDPITVPSYGNRERCGLPEPSTPLERAVASAYEAAQPALISLRTERDAAFAVLEASEPEAQIEALHDAYLTSEFLGVLLPRLDAALADEGLRCAGCPRAVHPPEVEVSWSRFEPYFLAHVWPDPVVTGPDGQPKASLHICGGFNGMSEIIELDPMLRRAGYLAAFHTPAVHERATNFLKTFGTPEAMASQPDDDARTASLREKIGPYLLEDPAVRAGVCRTLERFVLDTGISVVDCG